MPLYLEAALQEVEKPDYIVVHIGTNDIHAGRSTEEIKDDFRKLHDYLKNKGIFLVISLLTRRSDNHRDAITTTNHMLIELAEELQICYSGNENIGDEHLNQSRLHLRNEGTQVLAQNFSSTINTIFNLYG
jgi:lysophospholipase L1-like esterase